MVGCASPGLGAPGGCPGGAEAVRPCWGGGGRWAGLDGGTCSKHSAPNQTQQDRAGDKRWDRVGLGAGWADGTRPSHPRDRYSIRLASRTAPSRTKGPPGHGLCSRAAHSDAVATSREGLGAGTGKAGCPPRTAPGHRPSSPGLLPSGPRRPRGFGLACCDARAPGMASGTFHQAPPASRGPCGWGSGWRTPDRLISVATGGTRLGPGAPVLPQVPDGGLSAASVPWCVHSTCRWAPTARSAEARAGDEPA